MGEMLRMDTTGSLGDTVIFTHDDEIHDGWVNVWRGGYGVVWNKREYCGMPQSMGTILYRVRVIRKKGK